MEESMDSRIQEHRSADLQVQVTSLDNPQLSASGQAFDVSQSGISVYLPVQLPSGSAVRLNINDSVTFGFVTYSEPERFDFRTGIALVQVLIGESPIVPARIGLREG